MSERVRFKPSHLCLYETLPLTFASKWSGHMPMTGLDKERKKTSGFHDRQKDINYALRDLFEILER